MYVTLLYALLHNRLYKYDNQSMHCYSIIIIILVPLWWFLFGSHTRYLWGLLYTCNTGDCMFSTHVVNFWVSGGCDVVSTIHTMQIIVVYSTAVIIGYHCVMYILSHDFTSTCQDTHYTYLHSLTLYLHSLTGVLPA